MKQHLNCYDTQSCIRCSACMINCSAENRVRLQREQNIAVEKGLNVALPHLSYLTPRAQETGAYPNARRITAFHHCNHCEHAPCMTICPTGAISQRADGSVVIDAATCVGCRSCIDACPYDVPVYDEQSGRTFKCIRCYDRVESGLKPACVTACPTGAMFSGPANEVLAEAQQRAERYSTNLGEKHLIYGAQTINSYVGKTGWLTIAPEKDAEAYGLVKNPHKTAIAIRNLAKIGGGAAAALAIAGTTGHFVYWLAKRKEEVTHSKEAPDER